MATTLPKGQLQPPGAGLPASELAWLRILFRVACSMISRNAGLRWFKFESEKFLTALHASLVWPHEGTRLALLGGHSSMGTSAADRAGGEAANTSVTRNAAEQ